MKGRPKGTVKYKTEQARKAAKKASKAPIIRSRYFRLVIPDLQPYKDQPASLNKLKGDTLNLLLQKQTYLQYYKLAVETHPTTGVPHLDILLLYSQSVVKSLNRFDYLVKHGHLTKYRHLNAAILAYGDKQDQQALTNLPKTSDPITGELKQDTSRVLNLAQLKRDPYRYLELQMLKDPFHFNLEQYCRQHDLFTHISGWTGIKTKLKDSQLAAANIQLRSKSGFRHIDKALIESNLNPQQFNAYISWKGYQTIVNYLNQMISQKGNRQQKSLNLLITGAPNTGKSALVWQRNPLPQRAAISNFCSVYPIGMSQWFPKYQSDVYHCIYWNQAKLTSYSYDTILKLLDGSPLDLPNKGSVSRKVDNPLIIMTSNMTLEQMIVQKFGNNPDYQQMARKNLAVRVQNLVVPKGKDLFLLQKLLVPA